MNRKLYYCEMWEHKKIENYEICVSNIIYSNDKSMAQIHMLIMQECMVIHSKRDVVYYYENEIQKIIRNNLTWKENATEQGVIKIWYFNEDNSPVESFDIPMRITITMMNISVINPQLEQKMKRELEELLEKFVYDL